MRLDGLGALVRPRFDETLYSVAARLSVYLGVRVAGDLHRAIFGADMPVFDVDLPVGLDMVARSGVFGPADAAGAAREWTLFPYHSAFASGPRIRAAEQAMAGTGTWPQAEFRGALTSGRLDPLRFCLECREDMLGRHADLWWRRAHQLSGVLVCPEHGGPLHWSSVGELRRSRYVTADLGACPSSAPVVLISQEPRVRRDLLVLAQMADALLDRSLRAILKAAGRIISRTCAVFGCSTGRERPTFTASRMPWMAIGARRWTCSPASCAAADVASGGWARCSGAAVTRRRCTIFCCRACWMAAWAGSQCLDRRTFWPVQVVRSAGFLRSNTDAQ